MQEEEWANVLMEQILLLSKDPKKVFTIASELENFNNERERL